MRRSYSRVQSFPSPDSESNSPPLSTQAHNFFAHNLSNLHHLNTSHISASQLCSLLDASTIAQNMATSLATTTKTTTFTNSDWKFIDCYLDSTALLLDACSNIHLRLETIRTCISSILVALHYLEGEHEPSIAVLQRVTASLDFSRFSDPKMMPRMKTFGRKQDACDGVSPELYKAFTGSWAMAVVAIGTLCSATCFRKKSMEELADTHLAAQALLKLVCSEHKFENSGLWRMVVKAVAGELRRRKDELEKVLPMVEENSKELYMQIVALRISLLGLLSKAEKEDGLEIVKVFGCEESGMDFNAEKQHRRGVNWGKVKTKMSKRSESLGRVRPICVKIIKRKIAKINLFEHLKCERN